MKKIIIQGFPGAFHEEAAVRYFGQDDLEIIPATTFRELAERLNDGSSYLQAMMAIENSIAGSLLQNYRILREYKFVILGEIFLRIKHNLMVLPGQRIEDIKEVRSHPMAINQCLTFFKDYTDITLVESDDTALSAKEVSEGYLTGVGAIASERAAEIYGLDIIGKGIETSPYNFTRFFLIAKADEHDLTIFQGNKASIYLRVKDEAGQLLKVLKVLEQANMNMSKLQSFPVLGKVGEYYFYLDIEFEEVEAFWQAHDEMCKMTLELQILGIYQKSNIDDY